MHIKSLFSVNLQTHRLMQSPDLYYYKQESINNIWWWLWLLTAGGGELGLPTNSNLPLRHEEDSCQLCLGTILSRYLLCEIHKIFLHFSKINRNQIYFLTHLGGTCTKEELWPRIQKTEYLLFRNSPVSSYKVVVSWCKTKSLNCSHCSYLQHPGAQYPWF